MKLGKAYRIFMLIFCGGYLALALLLLIFTVWARWSNSDTVLNIYIFLASLYGVYPEDTGIYVRCCTPLLPAVVAVIYFLCIGKLREAWRKGELLPIVIPAGIGLTGLVFPGSFLILMILMPILYLWTVCIQIAGLGENKERWGFNT